MIDDQTFEKAFNHTFDSDDDDFYVITRAVIELIFMEIEENKEFPDRTDIYRGVSDGLVYDNDKWKIMKYYQTPEKVDFLEAYYDYISDITSMVEYITKRSLDE